MRLNCDVRAAHLFLLNAVYGCVARSLQAVVKFLSGFFNMRFVILLCCLLLTPFSFASGFLDGLSSITGNKPAEFLPPDQAFGLTLEPVDHQTVKAKFRVTPSYYLYREKISFTVESADIKVAGVEIPPGKIKDDPTFGKIEVFYDSFEGQIKLENNSQTPQTITINAHYMGCSEEGLCYPPITPSIQLTLPAAGTVVTTASAPVAPAAASAPVSNNEESKINSLLQQGNFWLIITFFFGAGLLLAFTPCMFPMIPILSGIIVGQGKNTSKKHAFILSLTYVLGMAITYAAAGVAAGYSGQLISNALQTPAVLGSFAAMFVLLSLAMFGFYELQLPAALQSKLTNTSNKLHGGQLTGVFGMGALSAIIIGPCVAAPLAGALMYISQTNDSVLGGTALFFMALGMGAPLLLIGTSAGALLPKTGAWMESVKHFFGVMLLGLAIWIIHSLLPTSIHMLLWAILLIFSSIYLRALDPLPHNAHGWHKLFKGLGVMSLLVGVAYLVGALSGATDMTRPLAKLGGGVAQAETVAALPFKRVKSEAELEQALAAAQGKAVMLDFYADWCVSCIEMEHQTFSKPEVQAKLANVVLLQVDVTQNTTDDKALLKRFGVFGPPVIVFFDNNGVERKDVRVTGFQDAPTFMATLGRAGL